MSERPPALLRIGITGHRSGRISAAAAGRLAGGFGMLFRQIRQALPGNLGGEGSCLRLVTGLADGADIIAAEAALNQGIEIHAVLPMAPESYAAHFPGQEAAESFRRLLVCAAEIDVLPGSGEEEDYAAAAGLLLRRCEMLIAVWEGQEARGRGGTGDVATRAVADGKPVVWMDPDGAAPPDFLRRGGDGRLPARAELTHAEFAAELRTVVRALSARPLGTRP